MSRESTHVVHVFSTFEAGGPQVRTAQLIAGLPEHYEHSILAMDGRYGCAERVRADRVRQWLEFDPGSGPLVPLRLAKFVLGHEPDLVLTYNWGAIETVMGCRLKGFRHVVHHEDGFGPDELVQQKRRRVWTRRIALRGTQQVVVPSRNLERIASEIWWVGARKLQYIPNGIEVERFAHGDRAAARRALDLPQDARIVGSVGHLRGEKDYAFLLRTFATFDDRDLHLLLAGDGSERASLETLAKELGIDDRVHFSGMLEDPRVAYHAMDVFTLSSATEQMPVSVLEAMAAGLPVVATDVGDVRAIVSESCRRFVVQRDGYASAMRELVADPTLRRDIGSANRQHCSETFPIEKMIAEYDRIFSAARRK